MQTCTECGTPITPAVGPPVLKDGNVVCQPCWQKAEAEAGDAPPRPASRPTSRGSALTRRGSSTPSSTSRRAASATPASRRSSSREEARPEPPSRATSRRTSSPAHDGQPYRAPTRTAALIEEVEHSTSGEKMKLIIIIVMCVMVIGAGIAGYALWSKTKRDAAEAIRLQEESDNAIKGVEALFKTDPNNFAKIREAINAAKDKVKTFPEKRAQLSTWESDVINNEQKFTSNAANTALLKELMTEIEDPTKRQSVRVKLDRARVVSNAMGKEYAEEVRKISMKLTLYGLKDGVDEAKAKEASGDLPGALSAYDEAVLKFNKEFERSGRPDADILNLYKELIAASDLLVGRVETPDFEAQIPERDMLSPRERKEWGTSPGAEFAFSGREVELKGVDTGRKILGVVSFAGWNPPWQDIVLDLNFTIVSGSFELYLRYWPNKRWYLLNFGPKDNYELNKPYQVTIRVKGSQVEMIQPDQPVQNDTVDINTSRTGGVGFGLAAGSKVIISSCKVKVLRPKT